MSSDNLGFHISVADGLLTGLQYALDSGCKSVQIFAGSNRSASLKDKSKYTDNELVELRKFIKYHEINVFIHVVYVINLCSVPASSGKAKYIHANILHDLELAARLGAAGVIVHLGSAVGNSAEVAIANLVSNLEYIASNMPPRVKLILESSSGQGHQVGVSLEEFHHIYSQIPAKLRTKIGICLDTAHIAASGYPINTLDGVKTYLANFDKMFGLNKLLAVHLNDNPYPVGSRRDVHEIIGQGALFKTPKNKDALKWLLKFLQSKQIPVILETDGAGKEGSSYPSQITYLLELIN